MLRHVVQELVRSCPCQSGWLWASMMRMASLSSFSGFVRRGQGEKEGGDVQGMHEVAPLRQIDGFIEGHEHHFEVLGVIRMRIVCPHDVDRQEAVHRFVWLAGLGE